MLQRVSRRLRRALWPTDKERAHSAWKAASGDLTLLLNHDLGPEATVFDLGGYEGRWTSEIFQPYDCNVYVFEPVPSYVATLRRRFIGIDKIRIHDCALGDSDREFSIGIAGDASSAFTNHGPVVRVHQRKFLDWFETSGLKQIDLLAINIEGAEYDLLDYLVETQLIEAVVNLQVQFHDFVPDAVERMRALQTAIAQTHIPTFDFYFIWNGWTRRPGVAYP